MRGTILSAVLSAAALAGCYATGDVGYRSTYYGPTSSVYVSNPDLVYVSPGVQVVADYDEPVFYTDGFYWRYYGGTWYRSSHYANGWVYYDRPPASVLSIERPHTYAHYRPSGYTPRYGRRYEPPAAIVRDHRGPAYGAAVAASEITFPTDLLAIVHRLTQLRGAEYNTFLIGEDATRDHLIDAVLAASHRLARLRELASGGAMTDPLVMAMLTETASNVHLR